VIETSPGNTQEWLLLERALSAAGAKSFGDTIRKVSAADACTGVVTQPYRLPGTPNFPDAKKRARRTTVRTQLLRVTGKVWSVDDLKIAFPQITNPKSKVADTQPSEKPVSALNGNGPTRSTPLKCTVVRLKVARKASAKMDRSRQFKPPLLPPCALACHQMI
jgi:hypothetical protein